MAKQTIELRLTSDECNYLERLLYQNGAYRQVIECLIEHNRDDNTFLTSPLFVEYDKEYQKIYTELRSYQDLLVRNYTPPKLVGKPFDWRIDPATKIMEIIYDESILDGGMV